MDTGNARGLFLVYNVSTIALMLTMSIYSSYLSWWWQNVDPSPYLEYNEWKDYYIGFLIMTILGIILLIWSLIVFISFLLGGRLFWPGVSKYLNFSLFVHIVFLVIPLLTMWIGKVIDARFIVWIIWTLVNVIMGMFLIGYFNQRAETTAALVDVQI